MSLLIDCLVNDTNVDLLRSCVLDCRRRMELQAVIAVPYGDIHIIFIRYIWLKVFPAKLVFELISKTNFLFQNDSSNLIFISSS